MEMPNKRQNVEEMKEIISSYGEFAHGGEVEAVAAEWIDENFTPSEADTWLSARCFYASAARKLADAGITPEKASKKTSKGIGGYTDTIGYKMANGDLDIDDIEA